MIRTTFTVDTTGGERKFDLLFDAWKDARPVLREFNKYKRAEIDELFKTDGHGTWPERVTTDSTKTHEGKVEDIKRRALSNLRRSLSYDLKRATRRHDSGKGSATAMIRRKQALEKFDEATKRGAPDFDALAGGDKRFYRNNARYVNRYQKAEEIASQQLGKIAQAFESKFGPGYLEITNKIPWAWVHNEGGVKVGRGAVTRRRRFAELTDKDADFLASLLLEAGLLAWHRG